MGFVRFAAGTRFLLKGQLNIIDNILLGRRFVVKNLSVNNTLTTMSVDELLDAWGAGDIVFEVIGKNAHTNKDYPIRIDWCIKDFEFLPKEQRDEAWRRYEVIRPLLALPAHERTRSKVREYLREYRRERGIPEPQPKPRPKPGEKRISPRKGVKRGEALSYTSVKRWIKDYLDSGGDIRSLVDEMTKCGAPGEKRLDSEAERMIKEVLDKCEKNRQHRTSENVYSMIVNRTVVENSTRPSNQKPLEPPSKPTVYRRIRERGVANIIRRRRSRTEERKSEPVQAGPDVSRILERVEFDDTLLHLIVVDDDDRLPIGRPDLFVGLDKYSGYPVGAFPAYGKGSYQFVMSAMLHSILPKPDVMTFYGTKNPWFGCGAPELAVIDNGKGYANHHLLTGFGMLGIPVDICPVRSPWFKASVERNFRTINTGLVDALPGSTLWNIVARGDKNPVKHACITLTAFKKLLHIFLLDIYAQDWHEGVKGKPEQKWLESEQAGFPPMVPTSADEARILLSWKEERTLQRIGIEFENITYQGRDLGRMRSILKTKEEREVSIRINPDDISYLYVLDPLTGQEWLRFDANDGEGYTDGLSLWKHRSINGLLLQEKKKAVDIYALADARMRLQQIVEDEYLTTKKTRGRSRAARFKNDTPDSSSKPPERVRSQGSTLAPPIPERVSNGNSTPRETFSTEDKPQGSTQKKGSNRVTSNTDTQKPPSTTPPPLMPPSQIDDKSERKGWGGSYRLPQRNQEVE